MFLAFDPGDTTGWALFDEKGDVQATGQVSLTELMDKCREWEALDLQVVIYEDFQIFRHKAPKLAGSRMVVSQAIGIIKSLARHTGAKIVQQPSNIKPIAQKWTQMVPRGAHSESHWVDAFNHGCYYLIKEGIRQSELERTLGNEV